MLAALEEGWTDDYHRRCGQLAEYSEVRREALAFFVECHNPMISTESGSTRFYLYARSGQQAKLKLDRPREARAFCFVVSCRQ